MTDLINRLFFTLVCCTLVSCFGNKQISRPQTPLDKLSSHIYIDEDSTQLLTLGGVDSVYKSWKVICITNKISGLKEYSKIPISEPFLDGRNLRIYWIGTHMSKIQSVRNDTLNGFTYEFYNNGKHKRIAYYKNNMLNGTEYRFDSRGKLWIEVNYKNGFFNGYLRKFFYKNGALMTEEHYIDGLKDGKEITYFKSGKISTIATFRKGKPDGIMKVYNRHGKIIRETEYDMGNATSTRTPE